MLLLFLLLFLPLLIATEITQPTAMHEDASKLQLEDPEGPMDLISDGIVDAVDTVLPVSRSSVEARGPKRKKLKLNKYLIPLLVGFMLIKSILLPITLKTLAILSGKAVVLSLMSLILAAIVGLKKVAQSHSGGGGYEAATYGKYRRQDMLGMTDSASMESEPYKFYSERRKRK
ncbi:protein Osi13 [Megalopta genalis]|uniref:protein Osi13 n=1 Tax=Megalopta genalis TaxID=115081 RepID=UPI0014433163|nr:uncharacterized protein LOC117229267 [Megalopta genalis]XP_033341553.1 uncharacterized protein LOC117229267 [Megalopta genalis]